MEEKQEVKKKKKVEISLGMAIFLIALFLFIIVAVIMGAIIINKKLNNMEMKEEIIQINAKGIVYTAFEEKGNGYNFIIPKINIDSKDVEEINNEIEQKIIKEVKKQIKESKKNQEDVDFAVTPCDISYKYYINGEILSLVLEFGFPYNHIEYTGYNVNIKSGKKITNEEILKYKGVLVADFSNKLPEIYGNFYKENFGNMNEENELYEEYKKQYEKTISKENCNINNYMFLDNEGNINIIAKIYTMAGSGESICIIKIEDSQFIEEKEIEEPEKESEDKEEKNDDKLVEQAKEASEKTKEAIKKEQQLLENIEQNTQPEIQEEVITFDQHSVKGINISYPSNWVVINNGYSAKITSSDNQESYVLIYPEEYTEDDLTYFENWYSEASMPERRIINGQEWLFVGSQHESPTIIDMITVKNNWYYNVAVVIKEGINEETINRIINSITIPEG
ncbi:MAG: hypothetical protein IJN50_05905 [Clostridia bacterium]|nr:hypothetical protein [Clostridia bacterium]